MAARALLWVGVVSCCVIGSAVAQELQIITVENNKKIAAKVDEKAGSGYWLGVVCAELKKAELKKFGVSHGLLVEEVIPNSPAAAAGMKVGDLLMSFGDTELKRINQLIELVVQPSDKRAALRVVRDGEEKQLKVLLAKRPSDVTAVVSTPAEAPTSEKRPAETVAAAPKTTKSEELNDREKSKLLMDAARRALANLKEVKAQEDAEEERRNSEKLSGNIPEGLEAVVGQAAGGSSFGNVRYQGGAWRVTRATVDHLPEEIRDHVEHLFDKVEAETSPAFDAPDAAVVSRKELARLDKRISELDEKLENILTLLKKSASETNKKKK